MEAEKQRAGLTDKVYTFKSAEVKWSKIPAILTWPLAVIAFALGIVATLAGGNNAMSGFEIMNLNTSTVGQNTIKVTSNAKRSVTEIHYIDLLPRDPGPEAQFPTLSLPGASQIDSFISSLTATASSTTATSAATSGLLSEFESIMGDVLGKIVELAGSDLVTATNGLIRDVVQEIGVKDWYSLYGTEFCEGNYVPNYSDPNAKKNVTGCTSLMTVQLGTASNSTINVGSTTIDYSALNISNKLASASPLLHTVIKAILALKLIGDISCGLLILLVPLNILIRRPWFRALLAALAALASFAFLVDAVIVSAIAIIAKSVVNGAASGFSINAYGGGSLLAVIWVSTALMLISSGAWGWMWFRWLYVKRSKVENLRGRPVVRTAVSRFDGRRSEDSVSRLEPGSI